MQNNNPSNTPAENKMGVQPVGRLLAGMAVPMMISMLVQALYNVVDSIFVSRLSENALTAVSLAFPLQNLMIAVCAGTTVGMNALLSRSLGAKEQDKADQAANTGIFLALCSFVLFCVIGVFFSRTFFQLQTDVTEIVSSGTIYAQICLGCSIGIFCQFTFERLLQSTGRTHLSMCTQLLGALTNIILDHILIFGLFGAPRLGVAGAAVATVTGQCVAAVAALIMNLKCNPDIHIVPRKIRFHGPTVKNIYRIGFPSIVMQCIGSVMVFGVNRILISFTTTATAVFGAYFKLQSFIFMPVFGLNNGMVPIVAYNYGAKKPDRVKKTIKLAIFSAVAIMAVGLAAFELAPGALLSLFDASENMLAIGTPALPDHRPLLRAGRLLHHLHVGVPGHRQPHIQPGGLRLPSAGGPAPGGVAAVPDGQPYPGLAGLPHRRAHVPDPQRHLPAQNPSHGRARHDPVRLLTHRPCL